MFLAVRFLIGRVTLFVAFRHSTSESLTQLSLFGQCCHTMSDVFWEFAATACELR